MLKPAVLRNTAVFALMTVWGPRARAQTSGPVQSARTGATRGFPSAQTPTALPADTFTPLTVAMSRRHFDVATQRGLLELQHSGVLDDVQLLALVHDGTFARLKPAVRTVYLEALRTSTAGSPRERLLALVQQPAMDFAPRPLRMPTLLNPYRTSASLRVTAPDGSERPPAFDPATAAAATATLATLVTYPEHESALARLSEPEQLEAIAHVQQGSMPAISILMGLACWHTFPPGEQRALAHRLTTLAENPLGTTAMEQLLKLWAVKQDPESTSLQVAALRTLIDGRPLRELVLPPLVVDLDRLPRADFWLENATLTTRGFLTMLHIDGRRVPIYRSLRVPAEKLHTPSVNDLAEAFARTPPHLRARTTELVIESVPEPHNAQKALEYNLPGFEAAATVDLRINGDQVGPTHFWATSRPLTVQALVVDLSHEAEHPRFARWLLTHLGDWLSAQSQDGLSEEVYSVVNDQEDGATTEARYDLEEAQGRTPAGLPARYALLRQLEAEERAQGAPPPNP